MHSRLVGLVVTLATAAFTVFAAPAFAAPSFMLTPLLLTHGSSEPEISIGSDGTMGMVSLQWLFDPASFGTQLWTGPFGSAPTAQGVIDGALQHPGKTIFGAGDADVDMGSTGRMHATTLIFLLNPRGNAKIGVSGISCPSPASPT